jgi:hypothetical protein
VLLYLDFLIRMEGAANSVFAAIAKTPSYLCPLTYSNVRKMSDKFQLKRGIYEPSSEFRYLNSESFWGTYITQVPHPDPSPSLGPQ